MHPLSPRVAPPLLAFLLTLLGAVPALASVIVITDPLAFVGSQPIVSTETFDEFPDPTSFPVLAQSVIIDSVRYADILADPGWTVATVAGPPGPPASLFAARSLGQKTLTFVAPGRGGNTARRGAVHALGFQFLAFGAAPGASPRFHFLVEETDGTTTDVVWSLQRGFLGFSSPAGIRMVTVTQDAVLGVTTNFAFDHVSRSAVVAEPGVVVLEAFGFVLLVLHRRRVRAERVP